MNATARRELKGSEWRTRDGRIVKIKDMGNRHLVNTLWMLFRRRNDLKLAEELSCANAYSCLHGDGALHAIESEMTFLGRISGWRYLHDRHERYGRMWLEARRRRFGAFIPPEPPKELYI